MTKELYVDLSRLLDFRLAIRQAHAICNSSVNASRRTGLLPRGRPRPRSACGHGALLLIVPLVVVIFVNIHLPRGSLGLANRCGWRWRVVLPLAIFNWVFLDSCWRRWWRRVFV
jgi:hypothetical protein